MKTIKLLLSSIVLLSLLLSCSKDDIDNDNTLTGSYKLTSWRVETPIDLDNDGVASLEFAPGCLNDSELNLSNNHSGSLLYTSFVSYNTYLEDGTTVFATSCSMNTDLDNNTLSYTESETSIFIELNGNTYSAVKNGNTLLMHIPNGFIATDVDTSETTFEQDVTYVFTKQ